MNRRRFVSCAAGGLVAMSLEARSQPAPSQVVGFLSIGSPSKWVPLVAAFRGGLNEAGYRDGGNVRIEFRWAEGQDDRLAILAAELVRERVNVLVATGGPRSVLAAKGATSKTPIVFTLGADPVKLGVVATLGRPGANITGVTFITGQLNAKRLELLHALVPGTTVIALLVNPDNPNAESVTKEVQEAARSLGLRVHVLRARTELEIDTSFAALAGLQAGALFVGSDGFFYNRREQLISLATRHAIPASFELSEFVTAGGLMSYGASLLEVYRQAGIYSGRILGGAKPSDLPVLQPTKVDLVLNARTAKALGITMPQSLLLRAQEVIQ